MHNYLLIYFDIFNRFCLFMFVYLTYCILSRNREHSKKNFFNNNTYGKGSNFLSFFIKKILWFYLLLSDSNQNDIRELVLSFPNETRFQVTKLSGLSFVSKSHVQYMFCLDWFVQVLQSIIIKFLKEANGFKEFS